MKKSPSEVIKKAKLLIIDEISMLDKKVLECVDKKLRKFCENEMPFAGKSVIMSGDRQQLVPPSGLKNSIYACAELMTQFHHVELREQMRQSGDPEFNQWLRRVCTNASNAFSSIYSKNRLELGKLIGSKYLLKMWSPTWRN